MGRLGRLAHYLFLYALALMVVLTGYQSGKFTLLDMLLDLAEKTGAPPSFGPAPHQPGQEDKDQKPRRPGQGGRPANGPDLSSGQYGQPQDHQPQQKDHFIFPNHEFAQRTPDLKI